ncbi:uncharacterized protein CCR75_005615 [Bremia lactucae]|uniref:HECT-type E3 ubiquitin transferase E3D n=1 Tax=Bremia lactucae TaxID=4779 RepID=A0A976FGW3_BRELC|nr:hypothetical protein CCR75_005615 [Bremia lactucae]
MKNAERHAFDVLKAPESTDTLARRMQKLQVVSDSTHEKNVIPTIVDSLVEYHANIGCYQCYLFLDCHEQAGTRKEMLDVTHFRIVAKFPRINLAYMPQKHGAHAVDQQEDVKVVWWTDIERNVDIAQSFLEDKNDHWYMRLAVRPSDMQLLGGFSSFTQVSYKELRPKYYASVRCRGCNTQLLQGQEGNSIVKVLPLPSANWMDMFDFWGVGIGAFEHIPRDTIQAQQHRVLVGESYVLLHASDFVAKATVRGCDNEVAFAFEDDAVEEHDWVPLMCAACSKRVGSYNIEQPDTIRLDKHLISACNILDISTEQEDAENIYANYTNDSILSAKLLELADSDGKFRFVLTSSCADRGCPDSLTNDTSKPRLQLQLLGWETMIKRQHATKYSRVLKVLYGPRQPMHELLSSHQLILPPAFFTAIIERLRISSTMLPLSLRTFNRLNIGYLYA